MRYVIMTLSLIIMLSSTVAALGVVAPYWAWDGKSANPLVLNPGASKDIQFGIQNLAGAGGNVTMYAKIVNGSDVAKITDSGLYDVPFGSGAAVHVRVTAPVNASVGDTFKITMLVGTASVDQKSGEFTFGSAFEEHFDLIITKEVQTVQPSNNTGWLIVALILAILIIAAVIYFVKRNTYVKKEGKVK